MLGVARTVGGGSRLMRHNDALGTVCEESRRIWWRAAQHVTPGLEVLRVRWVALWQRRGTGMTCESDKGRTYSPMLPTLLSDAWSSLRQGMSHKSLQSSPSIGRQLSVPTLSTTFSSQCSL